MERGFIVDNPNLLKQWHWEKNAALSFFPDKLKCASNKRVWWKCEICEHEWISTPNNRSRGQGCPLCNNKILIKGKNDLKTCFPQIAKKWHPTLNEKQADEVFPHSCKKAWWICEKDNRHIFQAKISHLTEGRIFCPICSNQKIIIGVNDLATTNPELLAEWDYDKNNLIPQQVTYGTNKKVWWKCKKGHNWYALIATRGGLQKTGCPYCSTELKISLPEKALVFYLSRAYEIEENKHFSWLGRKEIDIYIPSLNLGIEYDGIQWHKNPNRDALKDALCHKNGLTLLRIREDGCPIYPTTALLVNVPIYRDKVIQLQKLIQIVFSFLNQSFASSLETTLDIQADFLTILANRLTLKKEKSVASSHLIVEWDFDKNKGLDPALVPLGTHQKAWWTCKKAHSWQASIGSRASGVGCPYCAGQRTLTGVNDLQTHYPQIAKEWDSRKNLIPPTSVSVKSNKKYWWKCHKCGHEWSTSPADRTSGKNCPKCGREKTTASHYKKVINLDTGQIYSSIKEAALLTKGSCGGIGNCCRGTNKTSGGYRWKFL